MAICRKSYIINFHIKNILIVLFNVHACMHTSCAQYNETKKYMYVSTYGIVKEQL